MKKTFILLVILLVPISVFATKNTTVRTKDNLLVNKNIEVTDENIESILSTPAVSSKEKIYDYADMLSKADEDKLFIQIDKYIRNNDIDCVILTTKDLGEKSIADYAYNFYDYNFFLKKGVILLIYQNKDDIELFMGVIDNKKNEVSNIYTEPRISQILEYVYNKLNSNKYLNGLEDYITLIDGYASLGSGSYVINESGSIIKVIPWLPIIILSCAVSFIIVILSILKANFKIGYKKNYKDLLDKNTLLIQINSDNSL